MSHLRLLSANANISSGQWNRSASGTHREPNRQTAQTKQRMQISQTVKLLFLHPVTDNYLVSAINTPLVKNLYLFSIFEGVKEVGVQSACRTGMPIVLTASVSIVISDNS